METKEFAIKRKLYERKFDTPLKVIAFDRSVGFIELDKLKKLKRKAGKPTVKRGNSRRSSLWVQKEDKLMACMTRCKQFKQCSSRFGADCKKDGRR
ncbi:hypothetical protein BsIDN1_10640 [Bacillus safensis]|uniref:Uncharacterized protein n=1 Tax=Bacillus safensis TaxID=561879 RepID=A0A5S9M7F0_BACIA|nr:hypothetical protein BsIDN1_10640 [Bacillus safensis]